MTTPFTKMHGLGNDFMVVSAPGQTIPSPARIRELGDRRTGVGFDQMAWLEPARTRGGDIYYRIFNRDGSEAEQSGNGARCVARYLAMTGGGAEFLLEHATGVSRAEIHADETISVDMGVPSFRPADLPFIADAEAREYSLAVGDEQIEIGAVSMGNPHAVLRVDDINLAPVTTLGPRLERHERFPKRANIGFLQVIARDLVRLRVYERGAGETQACGTGACAAAVVGQRAGWLDANVRVELPGGPVNVRWDGRDSPVWLNGEAVAVFEGTVEL